jgi:hypothetical protein
VGTHHLPPESVSNSGLTEELDQRIGTAAAHAVRNVPVAKPEEHVGSVLDGMRGSSYDSAVVVASLGPRYREDLCLDAAAALEDELGIITPIDPS